MILLEALAAYAAVGAVVALAFLSFGLARVLGPGAAASLPARCLWFPGAVVFWPLILMRWRGAAAR